MKKKLVIFLSLLVILFFGINYYKKKTETVECWWGVMYPSLSYIGFEDETKISSTDTDYVYADNKIKYKFAIVEWFNNLFSF